MNEKLLMAIVLALIAVAAMLGSKSCELEPAAADSTAYNWHINTDDPHYESHCRNIARILARDGGVAGALSRSLMVV
jgi:hypothetical protein